MIKAIIFDCFGVLTSEAFHVFRNEYFSNSIEKRAEANKAMDDLNSAFISYEEFIKRLANLSGASEKKVDNYLSNSQPNEPLLEYIKDYLKPKYKIGVLSNAGANWLERIFGKEGAALFDGVVLSYEYRILKPASKLYKIAARQLGVKPAECIFIDDNSMHCKGAKDIGMKAIWYQGFPQLAKELEALLVSSANY